MKICIIMSTYNGEKFVKEQLDSIVCQDFECELIIYIRDDGSTDNTPEILERYKVEHEGISVIVDRASNVGASKSFLTALRECPEADIYAFSDQDDVWERGKLRAAVDALNDKQGPVLWISDYEVVGKDLSIIKENGMGEPCLDLFKVLFYNNIPGCVMVFNQSLLNEMRRTKIGQVRMHDVLALNVALMVGEVVYDEDAYTKYRQHDANALGYTHKKIKPFKWLKDKIGLVIHKEPYDTSEYASEMLRIYGDILDDKDKEEYILISRYRKSFISKMKLLSRPYTKYEWGRTRLSVRSKILLGLM